MRCAARPTSLCPARSAAPVLVNGLGSLQAACWRVVPMRDAGRAVLQIRREVLAHVRFGELEMPSDVDIVFGHLEHHREARLTPAAEASHYAQDMAAALAGGGGDDCGGGPPGALEIAGGGERRGRADVAAAGLYDDADDLEVHSTCTCGSFGIASNRTHAAHACTP